MSEGDVSVNKAVVRRHLEVAVNEHRPELWDEIMAEDLVVRYRPMLEGLWMAFPDLNVEILDVVAEGDRVVVRYFERGTHRGELFGAKGTGRSYKKHGFATYRLIHGRITEIWVQQDLLGVQRQLEIAIPTQLTRQRPAPQPGSSERAEASVTRRRTTRLEAVHRAGCRALFIAADGAGIALTRGAFASGRRRKRLTGDRS